MPFSLQISPNLELAVHGHTVNVTEAELAAIRDALAAAPDYQDDFDHLIVLAPDADYADFSFEIASEQARQLVENMMHRPPRRVARTAFLCANPMQTTMTRMFSAYVMAAPPPNVEFNSFTELHVALDWIEPSKGPERHIDRKEVDRLLRDAGQDWWCRRPGNRLRGFYPSSA